MKLDGVFVDEVIEELKNIYSVSGNDINSFGLNEFDDGI